MNIRQDIMGRAWALYRQSPARWFNRSRFNHCLSRAWAEIKVEASATARPVVLVSAETPARIAALQAERYAVENARRQPVRQ
jgi:hypothetical protein